MDTSLKTHIAGVISVAVQISILLHTIMTVVHERWQSFEGSHMGHCTNGSSDWPRWYTSLCWYQKKTDLAHIVSLATHRQCDEAQESTHQGKTLPPHTTRCWYECLCGYILVSVGLPSLQFIQGTMNKNCNVYLDKLKESMWSICGVDASLSTIWRWWARYHSKCIFRHFQSFPTSMRHLDTMYDPEIVLECVPSL